jgi:hypothetical protein
MPLDLYEEKWIRKLRASRNKWLAMVKKAESFDSYVAKIAAAADVPEASVRASFPAKSWQDFQANAEKYVDLWISMIEAAYRQKKWSTNYRLAFSTPG